ncbi:hypothetical protein [Brevibacillus sp. NRS-1366]|uniref:hypothetical protein n=1 Tax=Brevibacillus sp. NRS-1366 TaxID=3233899 RepID=UPI003D213753
MGWLLAEMCDRVMYAGEVIEENNIFSLFKSPKHPSLCSALRSCGRKVQAGCTPDGFSYFYYQYWHACCKSISVG